MATNPYINNTTNLSEQRLLEDITVELIQGMGQDCFYIPRKYFNIDRLFGEDPSSMFEKIYTIEMYLISFKGFEGTDVITQFGIEIKDKVILLVARRRFKEQVTDIDTEIIRPREGDLIYFPQSKSLFEINFVEHENPMYPLGKLYSYQITAELFTYSYEKITTPNQQVNQPYTSTGANSGATFLPDNNILGTPAGINEILEDEASLYSFDANNPGENCNGGA
jgi:hypothetical protein